jgi:hypothetical protein
MTNQCQAAINQLNHSPLLADGGDLPHADRYDILRNLALAKKRASSQVWERFNTRA